MILPAIVIIALTSITPLGKYGATYPITEKDASVEIEERISNVDPEPIKQELQKKFREYTPKDWTHIPPAPYSTTYLVDITYTLDRDIPTVNKSGKVTGILYPKGYQFNPLDYTPADPTPLVIFNPESKTETDWVKYWYKDKNVMLIATGGDIAKVSEEIGTQVYYLKEVMATTLKINSTVSVVSRSGNRMKVEVYAVQAEAKEANKAAHPKDNAAK